MPDTYACQRCGRATGLDAVATNEVWGRISEAAGGLNLLCLWCMDELAAAMGIEASVSLHFAGRALVGTSQSDADHEHIARLAGRLWELEGDG
jgi:hypothetical protein